MLALQTPGQGLRTNPESSILSQPRRKIPIRINNVWHYKILGLRPPIARIYIEVDRLAPPEFRAASETGTTGLVGLGAFGHFVDRHLLAYLNWALK
jgi:hypothetical protein